MRVACLIFFLLLWSFSITVLYERMGEKQQQFLNENNSVLATTYSASVAMYRLATETFVKQAIQRPEVLETFAEGGFGPDETRDLARGRLYRLLSPAYAHLRSQGVEQLQFQTADGHSFLRFHAPDKYGDPLFEFRPSIRLANTQRREIFGLEIGRLSLGFRYVFPLSLQEKHLGTVEASVTFRAISEAMAGIDPGREFLLVLHKNIVDRTLFEEQRLLFEESPIHDDFLIEDPRLHLPVSPPPPSETLQKLNEKLKKNRQVQEMMPTGTPFSVVETLAGEDWALSFVPADDIAGENVAYVISYSRAPFIASLRHEFWFDLLLATLATGGLFLLSMRLLKSHATLREEKQHLQIITDTIADGLCVMDPQGRIVRINPAFTDILGYREDEILGEISHHLFHVHENGKLLPLSQCPIILATSTGEDYAGEEVFRHKDGRLLTVELSCKPIIKDAHCVGSVTAFRDITERKAAQERLKESDRIKSEFIATASHELRTPLAAIQGYAELLRDSDGLSADQIRDFEAVIYDKSIALEKIIDELLDVSRIETGRPVCLEYSQIDLVDEIRQIVAQFEKEADDRRFSMNLPDTGGALYVDKFKIVQVLENLLNNAVKFSPEGSEIVVSGEKLGGFFQVMVADKGVGIAAEKQTYIFEKFFRVDTSDTALPGFGLGLYLVKRIVDAHRGKIWIESAPGHGTKVFFTLPINTLPPNP